MGGAGQRGVDQRLNTDTESSRPEAEHRHASRVEVETELCKCMLKLRTVIYSEREGEER